MFFHYFTATVLIPIYVHFSWIFQQIISQAEIVLGKEVCKYWRTLPTKPCTTTVILPVTSPRSWSICVPHWIFGLVMTSQCEWEFKYWIVRLENLQAKNSLLQLICEWIWTSLTQLFWCSERWKQKQREISKVIAFQQRSFACTGYQSIICSISLLLLNVNIRF